MDAILNCASVLGNWSRDALVALEAVNDEAVALLTFSLTMEFSDQSDTWVDVAALLRTYLLIWDTSSSPC